MGNIRSLRLRFIQKSQVTNLRQRGHRRPEWQPANQALDTVHREQYQISYKMGNCPNNNCPFFKCNMVVIECYKHNEITPSSYPPILPLNTPDSASPNRHSNPVHFAESGTTHACLPGNFSLRLSSRQQHGFGG